jgi:predicted RNA-binding Zn-ribbon protein involved in translation (DUF1610 family)
MTAVSQVTTKPSQDLYANPEARKILEFLIRNPGSVISPSILPNDETAYPQVESILGDETSDHIPLLKTMTEGNAIVSELVDKVPSCPACGSRRVSTRYLCPQCFTFDINQTFLFEHLKCGKVGSDDSFRKGDALVCPKCQAVLHDFGVEYRSVGAWYKCNRCDHTFNTPVHSHFCRPSHHEFTPDRLRLIPIFQYRINTKLIEEVKLKVLVYAEAITLLQNLGVTILAPHSLPGKSGQPQTFDIVLTQSKKRWRNEEKTMVIDIIIDEEPVGTEVVKNFNAKVKEVKPTDSWLIAVPGLTDAARKLIGNLKLSRVEGATLKEAMQTFQSKSDATTYVEH